jgi:two-component system, NtrC family, nitrogen regulation sensor histidine kinase NtrY
MRPLLKGIWYKYGFLMITAAWLFTLAFVFNNYWSKSASPGNAQKALQNFIGQQEKAVAALWKDSSTAQFFKHRSWDETKEQFLNQQPYFIFLYDTTELLFWNTNRVKPNAEYLDYSDGKYFIQAFAGYFELIKQSRIDKNGTHTMLAMVPILWDYNLDYDQFPRQFANGTGIEKYFDLVRYETPVAVKNTDGNNLFYLQAKSKRFESGQGRFVLMLNIIAIIFVFLFLQALAVTIREKRGLLWGALFLLVVIVGGRLLNTYLAFPFDLRQFELFNPMVYASSVFLPSLGDLFLNVIGLYWIVSFLKFNIGIQPMATSFPVTTRKQILGAFCIVLLVVFTVYAAATIKSLVIDSKISFNILNFSELNYFSIVALVVICLLVMVYYHGSQLLLALANYYWPVKFIWKILLVFVTGLSLLSFKMMGSNISTDMFVLVWLSVYMLIAEYRRQDFNVGLLESKFLLGWTMFFALFITWMLVIQFQQKELENRKARAEKLALQTDPSGESILSISLKTFREPSPFLQNNFYRLKSEYSNRHIKDSLTNENFSGYLNKYDTRIFVFDELEQPLFNREEISYNVLNTSYNIEAKPTTVDSLKYYDNALDRFAYLYKQTIFDTASRLVGYLFIEATPKQYKSDALYPHIFERNNDYSSDQASEYPYAIYSNRKLIEHSGDYRFTTLLDTSHRMLQTYEERQTEEASELWFNGDNGREVVLVYKERKLLAGTTMFAYLFCALLLTALIVFLGKSLIQAKLSFKTLRERLQLTIRNQVHITIFSITLASFLVIGIATISFFNYRYEKNNTDKLSRSIQIMAREMEQQFNKFSIADDRVQLYEMGASGQLQQLVVNLADIHGVQVNLYSPQGDLRVSSQPFIYNQELLSDMMEPAAFYHLSNLKQIQYVMEEKIGQLRYTSIYVPVRNENGAPYAFLNIPNFYKQSELRQEIGNFLITLINLNAFIFILAGAIAYIITNQITSSFSVVAEKMKAINLGVENEQIEWKKNDEIGGLVAEYNKMVDKLETSAVQLAKNERESAWREMAKQVAHEIKNPLTPMKLSIQYLQKAVDNNSPNVKELSQQVANTLVEQIDHLSKIAADFSQFANIGLMNKEMFNLDEILQSLVTLYNGHPNVEVTYAKAEQPLMVEADKTQLNRLFTNLLQNAVEASNVEPTPIFVRALVEDGNIKVSVKDFGSGIPENMREKIFIPNFTTKSSGTGLGLAICKAIAEGVGGNIHFETVLGEGTVFHVRIPLHQ